VSHYVFTVLAAALLAGGCVQAAPPAKSAGPQADRRVSRGEEGAIRDTVRACWYFDSKDMPARPVKIRVERVNPDSTVSPSAVSILHDGGSPLSAKRAVRAILNPACQPWPTPPGGWPDDSFILVFDPKDRF